MKPAKKKRARKADFVFRALRVVYRRGRKDLVRYNQVSWWISPPRTRTIMVAPFHGGPVRLARAEFPWMAWGKVRRWSASGRFSYYTAAIVCGGLSPKRPFNESSTIYELILPHCGGGNVCLGQGASLLRTKPLEEIFFNTVFITERPALLLLLQGRRSLPVRGPSMRENLKGFSERFL